MPRTDDNQAVLSAVAPAELVEHLKALAKRHNRTASGELREAVEAWVRCHDGHAMTTTDPLIVEYVHEGVVTFD